MTLTEFRLLIAHVTLPAPLTAARAVGLSAPHDRRPVSVATAALREPVEG